LYSHNTAGFQAVPANIPLATNENSYYTLRSRKAPGAFSEYQIREEEKRWHRIQS
jgi:hypothetical protein